MTTVKKVPKRKRDKTVYLTEPDPTGEYITIAEYIRRRHKQDLEKDATASPLYHSAIQKQIKTGLMEVYKLGGNRFIDWNKYKHFLFRRNFQMPDPK